MTDTRNDIVEHRPAGGSLTTATSTNVLAMVLEAARDPNIDAAKVETMANLAMRMQDREREEQFNCDKVAAIIEMPAIRRDGRIVIPAKGSEPARVQGRFVKYESLQAVISPILARHNLVLTHNVDANGQMISVQPILSHTNGYVEKGGSMPLPLDTSGGKNNTQGAGSSVSYGMRYTACAMLHIRIHGIDDDASGQGEGNPDAASRYNQEQRGLIDDGRSAALQGSASYEAWFKNIPAAARGWLAMEGEHDKLKAAAAKV